MSRDEARHSRSHLVVRPTRCARKILVERICIPSWPIPRLKVSTHVTHAVLLAVTILISVTLIFPFSLMSLNI